MSNENPIHTFTNGTTADGSEVTENFQDLYTRMVTAAGDTLTGTLNTRNLIPTANNTYDLGSSGNKFRNLYIEGTISGAGAPGFNFGTIAVSGQDNVVAEAAADTLTLAAGSNVTLTTTAASDTVTIGVTAPNAFGTVAVSGQSDVVSDAVGDTLTLAAGSNITLTTNAGTDTVTVGVTSPNAFGTVAVSGQSDVVSDAVGDTLTLAAGTNVTLTTNAGTDTVTITAANPISGGTDNRAVRCDGTTALQSSGVTIDDSGNIAVVSLSVSGITTVGEHSAVTLSTGNNNDLNMTDTQKTIFYVDGSAGSCVITGLTGGVAGRVIIVIVVGSASVSFAGESASSTAANRILLTSGAIAAGTGAVLIYADASDRWIQVV